MLFGKIQLIDLWGNEPKYMYLMGGGTLRNRNVEKGLGDTLDPRLDLHLPTNMTTKKLSAVLCAAWANASRHKTGRF